MAYDTNIFDNICNVMKFVYFVVAKCKPEDITLMLNEIINYQ